MLKQLFFLKFLIPFTVLLGFIQYYLTIKVFNINNLFYNVFSIYSIHSIITTIILLILIFINYKFPLKTGFAFMGLSLFKMILIVVILFPIVQSKMIDKTIDILSFFIPYFLFLFFETIFAIRLMNRK